MYKLCREVKPKATLEIGLAYGFSTVYFLAAIRENDFGHHTAVDPFQSHYHGIGWRQTRSLGMSDSFRFIEEKSVPALVHFADRGETLEVIFIDGNHRFDNVFVDFTLSAELCPMGGCITLDDMWMPSIRQRRGLHPLEPEGFRRVKTPVWNIAAFRRIGKDTREWRHYVEFCKPIGLMPIICCAQFDISLQPFFRRGAKAIVRFVRP